MFGIKSFSIDYLLASQGQSDSIVCHLNEAQKEDSLAEMEPKDAEVTTGLVSTESSHSCSDKTLHSNDECCRRNSTDKICNKQYEWRKVADEPNIDDRPVQNLTMKTCEVSCAGRSISSEISNNATYLKNKDAKRQFDYVASSRPHHSSSQQLDFARRLTQTNTVDLLQSVCSEADDKVSILSAAASEGAISAFRSPFTLPTPDCIVSNMQHCSESDVVLKMTNSVFHRLAAQQRLQQHVEWLKQTAGCGGVYIPRMLDFSGKPLQIITIVLISISSIILFL